jgi:acyl carrier protein
LSARFKDSPETSALLHIVSIMEQFQSRRTKNLLAVIFLAHAAVRLRAGASFNGAQGKLDRTALPKPTAENILRDDSPEAPQSLIEEHLTVVLSRLLGVTQVGSQDNFFTLGGHSLLGAQLIARIREDFGVEVSLRSLFDEPTVRGMSAEIETHSARLAPMTDDEAERCWHRPKMGLRHVPKRPTRRENRQSP